jgi:hypothetical protein
MIALNMRLSYFIPFFQKRFSFFLGQQIFGIVEQQLIPRFRNIAIEICTLSLQIIIQKTVYPFLGFDTSKS